MSQEAGKLVNRCALGRMRNRLLNEVYLHRCCWEAICSVVRGNVCCGQDERGCYRTGWVGEEAAWVVARMVSLHDCGADLMVDGSTPR
jgi:hypothetical protein